MKHQTAVYVSSFNSIVCVESLRIRNISVRTFQCILIIAIAYNFLKVKLVNLLQK